jgi:hypothetical protein
VRAHARTCTNPYHGAWEVPVLPASDLFAEAERQMREAVAPDKMRGNPHLGKPLHLEDNPFDQGMGMAYRMLRNAGFTKLPWMEEEESLRRARADLAAAVEAHLTWLRDASRADPADRPGPAAVRARHQAAIDALRAQAEALRRRILDFNLTVPVPSRQMANVNPVRLAADVEEAAASFLTALATA